MSWLATRVFERLVAADDAPGHPHWQDLPRYQDWARQYFQHYLDKPWSALHLELAEVFDSLWSRRGQRRCYVAPRLGAKSTHLSKLLPLYAVCHDLEHYIVLGGATSGLPEKNLGAIRSELEQNLALRADYPHACGRGPKWNEGYIVTRNGIRIEAVGRGCRVRGATHGQWRPGLIVGDDIDDLDSIGTEASREKCWDWLTKTIIPLGAEEEVNVLIAGTVLHPQDTTQRLRTTPGWLYRHFRSLVREPDADDLWRVWASVYAEEWRARNEGLIADDAPGPAWAFYRERKAEMDAGAEMLWPEKESLYAIQVYRQRNGERSFQSEKQGNAAVGGNEWPLSCFGESVRFVRWPYCQTRAIVCDPSKGANEKSDFSAWVWGGLGPDGLVYVDADLQRRDSQAICDEGVIFCKAFQPQGLAMENDAYGAIEALWTATCQRESFLSPPLFTVHHHGVAKTVRIRRLTGWIRGGRLRFRAGSPGADILLEQLQNFPTAKHDDGPDALEMLVRLLQVLTTGTEEGAGDDSPPVGVETLLEE